MRSDAKAKSFTQASRVSVDQKQTPNVSWIPLLQLVQKDFGVGGREPQARVISEKEL